MANLIVDENQAKLIAQARETIEIRDRHGNHRGYVAHGFSAEDIIVAKERLASDEARYSTREVLAYLRSLETE